MTPIFFLFPFLGIKERDNRFPVVIKVDKSDEIARGDLHQIEKLKMSIFLGSPPSSLVYGFLSFITTKAHATLRFTITLLASKGQIIYLSQAQKSYFNIYTTWLFRNKIWLVILKFFLDVTNNDVMYRKFSSGHGTNITHITPC